MTTSKVDVVIIGGGIAGLTAAFYLKRLGRDIVLIEPSRRVGGVIKSEKKEGFLLEHGPNTVVLNAALMQLIKDVGLENEQIIIDAKIPRYIEWNKKLHVVPMSPLSFLRTRLLSFKGKMRALFEPFIAVQKSNDDESLDAFIKRRFGTEVAERLVAPFTLGVWAGDSRQLSAQAAFPSLVNAEHEKGSVMKGIFSKKRDKNIPRGLISFHDGLEQLPQAIAKNLGPALHIGEKTVSLKQRTTWQVTSNQQIYEADHVVLAVPAYKAAALVPELSKLNEIPYAPLVVIHAAVEKKDMNHPLNGFGFLVAPHEKSAVLGCLWNSSVFPNRAPQGWELLTIYMNPLLASDDNLISIAQNHLKKKLKILSHHRIEKAIPQYTVGHLERIKTNTPSGLTLIGNYLEGISLGDVVKLATKTISRISPTLPTLR